MWKVIPTSLFLTCLATLSHGESIRYIYITESIKEIIQPETRKLGETVVISPEISTKLGPYPSRILSPYVGRPTVPSVLSSLGEDIAFSYISAGLQRPGTVRVRVENNGWISCHVSPYTPTGTPSNEADNPPQENSTISQIITRNEVKKLISEIENLKKQIADYIAQQNKPSSISVAEATPSPITVEAVKTPIIVDKHDSSASPEENNLAIRKAIPIGSKSPTAD